MKASIILSILGLTAFIVGSFWFGSTESLNTTEAQDYAEIADLESRIEDLEDEVSGLTSCVDDLNATIDRAISTLGDTGGDYYDLIDVIDSAESDLILGRPTGCR